MSPLFLQTETVQSRPDFSAFVQLFWPVMLAMALGGVSVYLLLPRPKRFPLLSGFVPGAAALVVIGVWLIRAEKIWVETVLFYCFSGIAILSGVAMISHKRPARAALAFAMVVLSTCGLFLLQAAPFLMAATIIIYAGAIIVTFLFVIMLAQQSGLDSADYRSRDPFLACVAGFVLLGAMLCVLIRSYGENATVSAARELEPLLQKVDKARHAESRDEVKKLLGQPDELFNGLIELAQSKEANSPRAAPFAKKLISANDNASQTWLEEDESEKLRKDLNKVYEAGVRLEYVLSGTLTPPADLPLSSFSGNPPNQVPVLDRRGRVFMPADNVAALGRSLFTDYLVAVELAATLLLVATIGAIAISGRRSEVLR